MRHSLPPKEVGQHMMLKYLAGSLGQTAHQNKQQHLQSVLSLQVLLLFTVIVPERSRHCS